MLGGAVTKKQTETQQTSEVVFVAGEQANTDPLWTMGQWGDFRQWICAFCHFDTLDGEDAILAHYLAVHAPPAPAMAPPIIQVYDRYGNPVERSN